MSTPEIVDIESFTVVGISSRLTRPDVEAVRAAWEAFGNRFDDLSAIAVSGNGYGVRVGGTADEESHYIAGVKTLSESHTPDGMTKVPLPANSYSVFTCTMSSLPEYLGDVSESWLSSSEYIRLDAPAFELYGDSFHESVIDSELTLAIPVVEEESNSTASSSR